MQQFEARKKGFSKNATSRRQIKLELVMPNLTGKIEGYNTTYNEILLSHADIQSCFDPVVEKIISLLEDQVDAVKRGNNPRIESIVLVGGLGESPYLRDKLMEWCNNADIVLRTPWSGG